MTDPDEVCDAHVLRCTDTTVSAPQIVEWFVARWQREGTFAEARAHVGIETQRPWADFAILRTTPGLLGLYFAYNVAHALLHVQERPVWQAAWYAKDLPTFADTIAFVRKQLWPTAGFWLSCDEPDRVNMPRDLLARLTDTLAFAA